MLKFSVIIPCYRSEDYVGKAIESVRAQSFDNYEILVMCEKGDKTSIKAVEDLGIKPHVDDYGSAGAGRNAGIDLAQGEYILFLDSDDWYLHSECFAMLNQFTRLKVDILSFGFIYGKYGFTPVCGNNGAMYPNVWSRVWRKGFLDKNNIRFPESSWAEDVPFVEKAFASKPHHTMTDIPFVYYTYPREGSLQYLKDRGYGDGITDKKRPGF